MQERIWRGEENQQSNAFSLVLLTVLITLSGGIFWAEAQTTIGADFPRLSKFGPIDDDNGFPVWYKDNDKTRLQLCLDVNDPYCAIIPEEIPDPSSPISLKNHNFPEEAFYQLASSVVDLPNGGRAVGTFALEASWANGIPQDGDQIVFGRIRFRIDGLITGKEYKITHPYGVDTLVATAADKKDPTNGEIRFVEDIGVQNPFEGAMKSRIGSFLEWDVAEGTGGRPIGYLGDPNVDHTITGGYNGQNVFKIEGLGTEIGKGSNTNSPLYCGEDCIQTNLFSVMGKKATTSGVDVIRATYSRDEASNGGTIDVFAYTEEENTQDIRVSTSETSQAVKMSGARGKYFTRVNFTGEVPQIIVTNQSDRPKTVKRINPVVKINASATYNTGSKTLVVNADSSDHLDPPVLKISEFGENISSSSWTKTNPDIIPPSVTIDAYRGDVKGGTVTIPVEIDGGPTDPPVADAGESQSVVAGNLVTLDGSKSTGNYETIKWDIISPEPPPNLVLDNTNPLKPTFMAENGMGDLTFQLTLIGPYGDESTSTVKVTVKDAVQEPVANFTVEPGLHVKQGSDVTLNATGSKNADTFEWIQTSGPTVTLNKTDPLKPTFKYPKKNESVSFKLKVTGTGGTVESEEVTITTDPDKLSGITAEYNNKDRTWKIDGFSDVSGPGVTVTISLGTTVITTVNVDPLGAFRFRNTGIPGKNNDTTLLNFKSSSGGTATSTYRYRQ